MQAISNRLIVKEDAVPEKIGSLFIPYQGIKPQTPNFPFTGIIVSCGPKVDAELKPGMRILFSRLSGMEVLAKYLVMKDTDALAIIED